MSDTNKTFQLAQFNFSDKRIIQNALSNIEINQNDRIVEIGPGQGLITEIIAENAKECIAYEIDKSLEPKLKKLSDQYKNVNIIWGDFLNAALPLHPYKIISNIPFNVTRPILEKIMTHSVLPDMIALVLQTEVCEKIARPPNENTLLSAFINSFYDSAIIKHFDRKDFTPPAHVNVALLQMKLKSKPDEINRKKYLDFLNCIFENSGQPIKSRLKKLFTYPQIKRLTTELKIPVNEAPYTLTPTQFKQLFLLHQKLNASN